MMTNIASVAVQRSSSSYICKAFQQVFRIPYSILVPLLRDSGLVTEEIAKGMYKINDLRQRYVHPLLEGNSYEDAKKAMNILCAVITSFYAMKNNQHKHIVP
jgi:hypothetical protein